ncbi:hypothetical protein [Actinoplanes sp. HUAS TT8]|uniref:hypothetical protein n=1 Tax=Actinoplanes sp. HUAS TT8 TaxID=3447453 RepID=UPI003F521FD9
MRDDHPLDQLLAALEGEPAAPIVSAMRASAERLADRRTWVIGPPSLLDQPDEDGTRWVESGRMDAGLADNLIGEWERVVDRANPPG